MRRKMIETNAENIELETNSTSQQNIFERKSAKEQKLAYT